MAQWMKDSTIAAAQVASGGKSSIPGLAQCCSSIKSLAQTLPMYQKRICSPKVEGVLLWLTFSPNRDCLPVVSIFFKNNLKKKANPKVGHIAIQNILASPASYLWSQVINSWTQQDISTKYANYGKYTQKENRPNPFFSPSSWLWEKYDVIRELKKPTKITEVIINSKWPLIVEAISRRR